MVLKIKTLIIFLASIINKNLKWSHHVNYIAGKISSCIGLSMIIKHALPTYILVLSYNSFISPRMTYNLLAKYHHNKGFCCGFFFKRHIGYGYPVMPY